MKKDKMEEALLWPVAIVASIILCGALAFIAPKFGLIAIVGFLACLFPVAFLK